MKQLQRTVPELQQQHPQLVLGRKDLLQASSQPNQIPTVPTTIRHFHHAHLLLNQPANTVVSPFQPPTWQN